MSRREHRSDGFDKAESDQIRSLQQQTDLRFNDLAVGRESLLQGLTVGGPGEPSDEASIFDLSGTHVRSKEKP